MGRQAHLGWILSAALGAAASGLFVPSVQAANTDYCVTCRGPDETYRCRVTGSGIKPSDAMKLYCVIRTAKEGNHASCSAEKATKECVGLVKVYAYEGPTLPEGLTSDPRVRELNQKVERNRDSFKKPNGEEPKSLFELGGRAVDASRKGLRNAGSAIGISGSETESAPPPPPAPTTQAAHSAPVPEPAPSKGFARRSYDCVLSLFRECSGDE